MKLIKEIKAAISITDIAGEYLSLKETGPMQFKTLCPFHKGDSNPSMSVDANKGTFHCFGCGKHGDVIDFFQEIEGLPQKEALARLAKRAGIESGKPPEMAQQDKNEYLVRKAFELAQKGYEGAFWADSPGRQYMANRGISEAVLKEFGIGFCPEYSRITEQAVRNLRLSNAVALEYGLMSRSSKGSLYDPLFGRVTFPVLNGKGIVAFGARTLGNSEAKYKNTSNSPLFTKGEYFFGFHSARKSIRSVREAIVTEGYIDVLAMHQAGFTNCIGTMGTAVTSRQLDLLKGHCDTAVFFMDGDSAGRDAAMKAVELTLQAGMGCKIASLPEGEDPDSLLRKPDGQQLTAEALRNARNGLDCWMEHLAAKTPEIQGDWISAFLLSRPGTILRMIWAGRIGRHLGVTASELLAAVEADKKGGSSHVGTHV